MPAAWLRHYCDRPLEQQSELWNNNHVTASYDPKLLEVQERLIDDPQFTLGASLEGFGAAGWVRAPSIIEKGVLRSVVPLSLAEAQVVVIQRAERKRANGWIRDEQGKRVHFVALSAG